jgi:hypothetical protein
MFLQGPESEEEVLWMQVRVSLSVLRKKNELRAI